MSDILHRVGIKASPSEVYAAITSIEGLAGWWTTDTTGETDLGGVLQFRFPPGGFDMKILELQPSKRVLWEVVDGPDEWMHTTVSWDLSEEDGFTIILFKHEGWKEPVEFMYHCSTRWGTFLLSLKALVETGKGVPSPDLLEISNWH
jgi:uncharacterized protein YndB with AHSA1/START domain